MPAPAPVLLGRRRECDELNGLVATVRSGRSAALVVSGEAGVGKSALLEYLCRTATGCRLVRAGGVESEMELVYAGLHQICAPFLDRLAGLPGPQAQALRVAFGLVEGEPPDRFMVGLATLSLLSDAAAQQPVICVIDDTQWLDEASVRTLAFVARRLVAESVAVVFALRDSRPAADLRGLPEMVVPGLRDDDARTLLSSVVAGWLDEQVRDRVVAETRGNPLALLELTRGMTAAELTAGIGPTGGRALPSRVEASFLHRIQTLPADVRQLLLVAAAEPTGDPVLLWRAAEKVGIAVGTADAAQTDGLLTIDDRVMFRHPLARSAAYRSATPDQRRAVHLALAGVTDRDTDPDRRAWHLASAAAGPDEPVAAELERCAGRAQARGGLAAAAAFLRRSVALTADPPLRARRALRAAEASLAAGNFDATGDLLAIADAGPLAELDRARVTLVRADAAFSQGRGGDGPALMLDAARALEPLDAELARNTYLDAWSAALFAGSFATAGVDVAEVSRRALAAPRPAGDPRPLDVLLEGFCLAVTQGRRAAGPVLERAVAAFEADQVTAAEALRWGWLAAAAANMIWEFDRSLTLTDRYVRDARDAGALTVLPVDLHQLAEMLLLSGDLDAAAALVDEAAAATEATGSQVAAFGDILYRAMRGREAEALPLLAAGLRQGAAWGQGLAIQHTQWSTAILYNGLGRHREAFDAADAACRTPPELPVSMWAASELVEAAVEVGELGVAGRTLAQLAEAAQTARTPWATGVEARCRALLVPGDEPEALFRAAVERLGRSPLRPELARAHLHFGQWLSRRGRPDEARVQLTRAHQIFTECRMEAFEERAGRALAEVGVRVPGRRAARSLDVMTAQEADIARLAAAGRSNPEIGAQLFVSPRTVEWHLHKVFRKLGVTSRAELAGAIADTGAGG